MAVNADCWHSYWEGLGQSISFPVTKGKARHNVASKYSTRSHEDRARSGGPRIQSAQTHHRTRRGHSADRPSVSDVSNRNDRSWPSDRELSVSRPHRIG